jgi:hypothetical protein
VPWAQRDDLQGPDERLIEREPLVPPLGVTGRTPGGLGAQQLGRLEVTDPRRPGEPMEVGAGGALFKERDPGARLRPVAVQAHGIGPAAA